MFPRFLRYSGGYHWVLQRRKKRRIEGIPSVSFLLRHPVLMDSANSSVFCRSALISAELLPSIACQTPRVSVAVEGLRRSRTVRIPSLSSTDISPGSSALAMYRHFEPDQAKSIKYQWLFPGTMAPPVARIPPSHLLTAVCMSVRTSSPDTNGEEEA
jgi:hypothetical protein